jgi:hypothetical protein
MSTPALHRTAHLERLSTAHLIRRMQSAPDFGYDDEAVELNRRLAVEGKTWKWESRGGHDVVVIIEGLNGVPA